jgi:hypothetical protein
LTIHQIENKMKKILLFSLLFASNVSIHSEEIETITAVPANDFLNSIGVNTSINARGESIYRTLEFAEYLGFRWIRTGIPDGDNVRTTHLRWLHDRYHIRFSIGLSPDGDANGDFPGGIPYAVEGAKELITALGDPDAIIAFEGCNEPNNWGIYYQGELGAGKYGGRFGSSPGPHSWKPLAKYHRDFYAALKADPVLGTQGYNYPVWSATDVGAAWENVGMHFLTIPEDAVGVDSEFPAGTTFADVACIHNYFSGLSPRTNNQTWLAADPNNTPKNGLKENFGNTWSKHYLAYTDEQLLTLPRVTTETGTTIDGLNVKEEDQALTYLSCYLSQYKRGFQYTAMYILRDRVDEGGNQTFGFYTGTNLPRQSAHYLHNLTTILADTVSITNPGTLSYGFSSKPETTHDLLLQKEDGTLVLVVWSEKFARNVDPDAIEVRFSETFGKINVYNPAQYNAGDPTIGTQPVATYTNVNTVPLAMLNHPFILEINPPETAIHAVYEDQPVKIYPNPVEDFLHINTPIPLKKIEIFDLMGKCVWTTTGVKAGSSSFDLSFLSKGSYILKLTASDNKVESRKVIKR